MKFNNFPFFSLFALCGVTGLLYFGHGFGTVCVGGPFGFTTRKITSDCPCSKYVLFKWKYYIFIIEVFIENENCILLSRLYSNQKVSLMDSSASNR